MTSVHLMPVAEMKLHLMECAFKEALNHGMGLTATLVSTYFKLISERYSSARDGGLH